MRDPARPLVWLHASSVGEGLQARPVAQALRAGHPDWQLAYTFFSPSAEQFAQSLDTDITDYLPFDRAGDADAMLDALSPSILVFAKLDVWPTLVERAAARGIPVALISGTLSAASGRRGWWSRQLVGDAYAALSAVGAIDAEHAERLAQLGVARSALSVTGDTRFDQVWAKTDEVHRASPLLARLSSVRPTIVAGSTWPADEDVLLPAWPSRLDPGIPPGSPPPRLIIAPHEPTAAHCAPIQAWAQRASLRLARLSELEQSSTINDLDVILVDRVGVLGELYALATVAFVGGGFHSKGLHSVIEPAAFGVPVVFGPQWSMSREAGLLLNADGAHSVSSLLALGNQMREWLFYPASRERAGAAARAVVVRELGATARTVRMIEQAMTPR